MSGLLIDGQLVPVPGVTVIGPHEERWAFMSPGDGMPRTWRPYQITLHKTLADDPERVVPGKGPAGHAQRVAEYWANDPQHSGAHIVTGDDGIVACLADVVTWMAYHARSVNPYSIGIETCEQLGGIVYQAALDSTVAVVAVLVEQLGIQLQCPRIGTYKGEPLKRLRNNPTSCVGIFGHRDNDDDRGRWDPGDVLFAMIKQRLGAEVFDFDAGEDIATWRERQAELVRRGHQIAVDGIPGPRTTAALKAEGYRGGVYALGKVAA